MAARNVIRLTSLSPGAGCGCKLGPSELATVMATLTPPRHPDLLVGTETGDDAMVWRRPDGSALVATTDFFTPIVDDARTWGRIAAANAASDVYAMGGRPLFALNLVAWPSVLPLELLTEVLAGGSDAADEGGWIVGGGHTIDVSEPLYGQAVVGEVDPDRLLTNAGGRGGDTLILTKPIGSGLVATAVKRSQPADIEAGGSLALSYDAAVAQMTCLNAAAASIALDDGATACTDVTGFGLLGHLHKLAAASGVRAVVDPAEVPVHAGAWELLRAGMVPGGTARNLQFVQDHLDDGGHDAELQTMLADPQTSGGLLFACPSAAAADALAALAATGHIAEDIGELVDVGQGRPGDILLL